MGLLSGSMALRRYQVLTAMPNDALEIFEKAIRAHALVPIDPDRNESKSVGWCSIFDAQDLDLYTSKWITHGHIVLSLRVDTLKPPADEIKRLLRQRQRELEAERKEPLSASALRELKDLIVMDLRRSTPVKTRTVDVLWDVSAKIVYFLSQSRAMNEAFLRLFAETFNVGLDTEGPGVWAADLAEQDDNAMLPGLLRAKPTIELLGGFAGLRPCPRLVDVQANDGDSESQPTKASAVAINYEDRRWLAREFLTWLIYRADVDASGSGRFLGSETCEPFNICIGERVLLKALGEGSGEITARGVAPAQTADVRFSIAGGLTVREVELIFERGDRLWTASVSAEGFDLRRVKLPSLLSEEDGERVHERIELTKEVDAMLHAAFEDFLRLRIDWKWQTSEVPKLREWLEKSIKAE